MAVIPPDEFMSGDDMPAPMREAMNELRRRIAQMKFDMVVPTPTQSVPFRLTLHTTSLTNGSPPGFRLTEVPPRSPDRHVTNFDVAKLPVYKTAIKIYEALYSTRHRLFIRHDAYTRSGHRIKEYQALHAEVNPNIGWRLDEFWRIFDVLKNKRKVEDPCFVEATIQYFKWKSVLTWGKK